MTDVTNLSTRIELRDGSHLRRVIWACVLIPSTYIIIFPICQVPWAPSQTTPRRWWVEWLARIRGPTTKQETTDQNGERRYFPLFVREKQRRKVGRHVSQERIGNALAQDKLRRKDTRSSNILWSYLFSLSVSLLVCLASLSYPFLNFVFGRMHSRQGRVQKNHDHHIPCFDEARWLGSLWTKVMVLVLTDGAVVESSLLNFLQ